MKQISAWKKLASFAIDSSKATIVSKALYNSEGSYGVIPEALNVPRFSTFVGPVEKNSHVDTNRSAVGYIFLRAASLSCSGLH